MEEVEEEEEEEEEKSHSDHYVRAPAAAGSAVQPALATTERYNGADGDNNNNNNFATINYVPPCAEWWPQVVVDVARLRLWKLTQLEPTVCFACCERPRIGLRRQTSRPS